MGCGKTSLGRKLAKKYSMKFIDLDNLIVSQRGKSIVDIFYTEGENQFRLYEQTDLHSLVNEKSVIISTGGGTPCFFNNMGWMNKTGKTVFLNISLDVLIKRLTQNRKILKRPLLKNKSIDEVKNFIRLSWEKRLPFYQKAKYIISSDYIEKDKTLDLLPISFFKLLNSRN